MWTFEIRAGVAGVITLLALALAALSVVAFGAIILALHPDIPLRPLVFLLALIGGIGAHEAIHAGVFAAFGGRPRLGAAIRGGMPLVYVSCPGQRFPRDQYLAVGLAPLVVLDLVGLALILPAQTADLAFWLLVLHTSGSAGDLWMAALLLQSPRWVRFQDAGVGIGAWAPPEHSAEAAGLKPPRGLQSRLFGWVGGWFAAFVLCASFVNPALVFVALRGARILQLGPVVLARSSHPDARGYFVEPNLAAFALLDAALATLVLLAFRGGRAVLAGRRHSAP